MWIALFSIPLHVQSSWKRPPSVMSVPHGQSAARLCQYLCDNLVQYLSISQPQWEWGPLCIFLDQKWRQGSSSLSHTSSLPVSFQSSHTYSLSVLLSTVISPQEGLTEFGVLLMITEIIYFQMEVNLIEVVKFSLSSGRNKLLHC